MMFLRREREPSALLALRQHPDPDTAPEYTVYALKTRFRSPVFIYRHTRHQFARFLGTFCGLGFANLATHDE